MADRVAALTPFLPTGGGRRRRPAATPPGELSLRVWLAAVVRLLPEFLPGDLLDFRQRGPRGSLVGFYYGAEDSRHYEAWVQRRSGAIEMGLHFEGAPAVNRWWLERLAPYSEDITAALGPGVEAEQWTARWTRVHEVRPLEPLSEPFAARVAARLASYALVLEPLVRSAGQVPDLPESPGMETAARNAGGRGSASRDPVTPVPTPSGGRRSSGVRRTPPPG